TPEPSLAVISILSYIESVLNGNILKTIEFREIVFVRLRLKIPLEKPFT
ncbi:unnamed protein product, partial [marine sediment metagenome]